jgi:hypothetical protein
MTTNYDQIAKEAAELCVPVDSDAHWRKYCVDDATATIRAAIARAVEKERVIETCDRGHRFCKLADHPERDGHPRCPHCMADGLAAARQRIAELEAERDRALGNAWAHFERWRKDTSELAALRRDKERMDWLEKAFGTDNFSSLLLLGKHLAHLSLRASVDAAMQPATEETKP